MTPDIRACPEFPAQKERREILVNRVTMDPKATPVSPQWAPREHKETTVSQDLKVSMVGMVLLESPAFQACQDLRDPGVTLATLVPLFLDFRELMV